MNAENALNKELEDYRNTILELKVTDAHFRRLLGEYEHIEEELVHGDVKVADVPAPDLDRLKSHQRSLREHLLQMIRCAEPMMV
jgi:uncharacterized protein YdcH (DUF465 family)